MSQPLADGWPDGWPSSSQPQESGKARSKAGPHKAARPRGGRLLLPPPLPLPPRRVRSGPPGGNEPLAPSPSVPPGQEPETPASCGAGKRWATPGFPSAFREHVTARRKPRRAGEGRGEGQLTRSLSLGECAGPRGRPRGARGRPRGACGPSREASGSAGGLPASCGPRRPRAPSSSPLPPLPCPPSPLRTGRPCPSFSLFSGRRQSLGLTLFLLPFLQMVLWLACFGPVSPSFSFWPLLPASRPPPGFCPSEGASACL